MRCLAIACLVACGGAQVAEQKTAPTVVKDLPATLEATHPKSGEPRTVHVRVWADAQVRALPKWKDDVTDQIDYASQFLTPLLGVKLVVDGYKDWGRTADFHDAVAELAKIDDGKDVTWVIGYVAPPDKPTKAMGELCDGKLLGHAIVVRWYSTVETDKDPEVRDAKKRHKQTVVLLHGLAQTLGAIAEADPGWIQNPAYSTKQSTFSDRNRELMQLAIDQRLTGGTDDTIAHDLLEAIDKNEWGGWIASDHDDIVKQLRAQIAAVKAGKTASDIPPAAIEQYDHIKGLAMKKQFAEALVELENVLTAYPANATLHELKCEILIAKQGVKDKTAMAACARVSELAPGDPSPHIAIATALATQHDFLGARAELVTAGQNIANLNLGQADAWKRIVALYLEMGALTWAEEAIAAGKLNDPGYAMIASTRARYGLPKGSSKVKPEQEGALVAALKQASAAIYASKFADAHKALDAIDKKWPGSPGALAFRCDLAMREGAIEPAKAYCHKALALDPDESWANYLAGVLALRDTSAAGTKAGVEKLKWAIAVDPDLGQAWRALAKAYARAKDEAALQKLSQEYAAKFGAPLPQ